MKLAVLYYEKAIKASEDKPLYQAINLRGYARVLFRLGRNTDGRTAYTRAIVLVAEESDSSYWFQAETVQRRAAMEADIGDKEQAGALIDKANKLYGRIKFPPRRSEGLRNLEQLRKRIFPSEQQANNTGETPVMPNTVVERDAQQAARPSP